MKRAVILLLLMPTLLYGADEVRAVIDGSPTAYFVIREIDGDIFYPTDDAFEVFGTSGHAMTDYDIPLTDKSGGFYTGTFDPDIAAEQYYIIAHQQAGGSPANADPPVWQEYGDWDGTSVWTPSTITAGDVWEEAVADHTGETTFGGEVGGLDPNLTLVLADTDELQQDWTDGGRLDLLVDAIKYVTDRLFVLDTTVAGPNDANQFSITAGLDVNDVYDWHLIRVTDADDGHAEVRWIEDYYVSREVFVDEAFGFVPAAGDEVQIMSTGYGGWLWEMLTSLSLSKVPVYYFNGPGTTGGASESAAGVTHIDQSGADPP